MVAQVRGGVGKKVEVFEQDDWVSGVDWEGWVVFGQKWAQGVCGGWRGLLGV